MNISVRSEYALQALFDLAAQTSGEPIRIADIARRQAIPQKFLELILADLKKAGFVESRRGVDGGYRLARPADQITIGQVLRRVEDRRRARPPLAPFSDVWSRVDRSIAAIVDQTSFAELVRCWNQAQKPYVPDWQI